MAKRSDSVLAPAIALIVGVGFMLFWISAASSHGAPAFFPLFGVVFLALLGILLGGSIFKTLGERGRNQALPVEAVEARVVTKRTEGKGRGNSHTPEYYATFELPTGERLELELDGAQYGLLTEDDRGELRRQGSWFLGFERQAGPGHAPEPVSGPALICEYCGAVNPPRAARCASCGSSKLTAGQPKVQT